MTQSTEQGIAQLENDELRATIARLSAERDEAVARADGARDFLLSGADESTTPGKFWANEIRHAFSTTPAGALARALAAEVDRLGVDIAYDEMFFNTDGDTSTGMRRAVRLIVERAEALTAAALAAETAHGRGAERAAVPAPSA